MTRVIIASKSEKLVSTIRNLIVEDGYEVVMVVTNQYELSRQIKTIAPNVVIIDEDLISVGASFIEAILLDQQTILLLGKAYQKGYYHSSPYLELCEKPIQPNLFLMTLRMLTKYSSTVRHLESKIDQLEKRQKTEKKIQEAKRALQYHEKMTEEEAHGYIQSRSMELRISKLEFATRILKRFEKNP